VEDEEWYVHVIRAEQREGVWQEFDDSWLELDGEESEEEARDYCPSACLRKDDSGLEDELEYFHNVTPPPETGEDGWDRWWSPGPQRSESEEDEEENQYLARLLMSEPEDKGSAEPAQLQVGAATALSGEGRRTPEREPRKEEEGPSQGG
jgi:hypothetical protein